MRLRTLLASAVLATLLAAAPAHAAVYTVTGTVDPGACAGLICTGIGAAVNAANGTPAADEIDLQATSYTVSKGLTLSDAGGVTIVGKGAQATAITANPGTRPVANTQTATLEHLKVTGGNVSTASSGGGISNSGVMTLDHVEVSGNTTSSGNGGGNGGGIFSTGSLTIRYSLIANNTAATNGGGLFITGNPAGGPAASTLNMSDSTVASNHATTTGAAGGGIVMSASSGNQATLERVTVGDNTVGGRSGGAGIYIPAGGGTLTAHATIVARNTMLQGPSANCSGAVTDGGANVEDLATCGFTAASDRQNVSPGFPSNLTAASGETAVLTIPASSPAVDLAPCSGVTDQRDLPRPQGTACDAGAYEVDQPPDVILDSGPSGVISGGTVTFTFHSDEPGVGFQCKLDGQTPGSFTPCVSPVSYAVPPGGYAFSVRAVDGTGNPSPTPASRAFTVAAPLPSPPVPVFHKSVVVKRVSGTVKVKLPGTNKFVDITTLTSVPLGSTIDVRRGKIDLTSVPKAGGKPQTARFYGGEFKITQPGGITQLQLNEPLARCPRAHAATAAAAKKKKPKTRSLWGDGHGSFRTKGQYSAATVRGTKWFVQDSCAGTLTRVAHGVVSVRDEVRHKTITLRAGKKYLARPRR